MYAGDLPFEIGDGGDHRWPDFGGFMLTGAIIAAGMEPQACRAGQAHKAAMGEIGFDEGARNRLRHGKEPLGGFG